jgi:FkbM family methyltransferase
LLATIQPIRGLIGACDAFIDVGGNRGEFSQIFAHIYKPSILICVEPNEQLNDLILSNTKGFNVIIINEAVSDRVGELEFYVHPDSQMSSLFSSDKELMRRDFSMNDPDKIVKKTVRVTTLDEICVKYKEELSGKRIFLKIDTQGNELDVLKGGGQALSAVLYCLLEYMFQSPYLRAYSFEDIVAQMSRHGFECRGPMHSSYRATGEVGAVLFLFVKKDLPK